MNIRHLSMKVVNNCMVRPNALQEAIGHSHLKKCCFLLGSVETPWRRCYKFC